MKTSEEKRLSVVESINSNRGKYLPVNSFRSRAGLKKCPKNQNLTSSILRGLHIKYPSIVLRDDTGTLIKYKVLSPINPQQLKGYSLALKKSQPTDIRSEESIGIVETTAVAANVLISDGKKWNSLDENKRKEIINRIRPFLNQGIHPSEILELISFVRNC